MEPLGYLFFHLRHDEDNTSAHRASPNPSRPRRSTPMWRTHGRSISAALVLIVTAVQAALSDSVTAGRISQIEIVQILIAGTNAALVYLVPNTTRYPWVKLALTAVLAVLQLLTALIIDGVSSADLSALMLAALLVLSGTAPSASGPATSDRRDALAGP